MQFADTTLSNGLAPRLQISPDSALTNTYPANILTDAISVQGPGASGKGAFSMGPSGALSGDPAMDRQKLFNGKELVTSAKSAYQLSWPILVWGGLLLLLYGISYDALSKESNVMVYTEMMHKSRVAASRVTYLAMRANLDPVSKAGRICIWLLVHCCIISKVIKPNYDGRAAVQLGSQASHFRMRCTALQTMASTATSWGLC